MSVERSFEAWEEVQRQGLDLADKLAHSFNGLIQSHSHHVITPPSFNWPNPHFDVELLTKMDNLPIHGVTSIFNKVDNSGINGIFDMGNRLGQVGADFGASLNGMVEQVFRRLPIPFRHDEDDSGVVVLPRMTDTKRNDIGIIGGIDDSRSIWITENDDERLDGEDDIPGFNLKSSGHLGRSQGTINLTSTYDSRTHDIESSLAARGDLWRIEASNGRSTSGSENSSLFLVQLGPVLFVRDSTLLLPVHLSKQHLLWYGYDRKASTFEKLPSPSHTFYRILLLIRHNGSPYKNGIHSLCPAVWSKHRRWLLMSMICLNPLTPSFVDLQFPNGQLTYVSGEGITTSTFLPFCGGLLQAQGQYPGEMKFSFSCKNKWGTRFTPMVQWPDKSFTFGLDQALAWKRSGLMVRPTIQLSLLPTFGGINPGLRGEFIHSLGEKLSLVYGCALTSSPSAYASVSVGRSKWNGNVGNSGVVLKLETPLGGLGRPSFSVQVNSGIEV